MIHIRRSCRDLTFTNTVINGYWDKFARGVWIRRRTEDNQQEQNNGGIMFNGFTCIDGPLIAFEGNGGDETYWGTLTNYNIHQNQQVPTSANEDPSNPPGTHWRDSSKKAVDVTSDLWQFGPGTIRGYPNDQSIDVHDWPVHIMNEGNASAVDGNGDGLTIAAVEKTCFYERVGNLVFCTATFKDIAHDDNDGASADNDLCVTLPFEPIDGSPASTIFTGSASMAHIDLHEGSDECGNIVCIAKKDNMYKKDNIQYKGYVKFKKSMQLEGDGIEDEYIKCSDIEDPNGSPVTEMWFQLWYICQPNAIANK